MRVQNWDSILTSHVRKAEAALFIWGENDCALFSCDFVDAVLGTAHASIYRGAYTSEQEAQALIESKGFKNIGEAIASILPERKNINLAKRGDLVMMPKTGCIGICGGRKSWFMLERGLIIIPTTSCTRSWEV